MRMRHRIHAVTRVCIIFSALSAGSSSIARAADRGLTSRDLAGIDYVGAALMSPDGKHIAYTVARPANPYCERAEFEKAYEDRTPNTELHVMSTGDGKSLPYITDGSFGGLKWLPDGSGLSFTAKRGDDKHKCLYVLPLGGGEARRVMAHETDIGDYDWCPDGKQVAFLSEPKEDKKKKDLGEKGFKAEIYEEDLRPGQLWIGNIEKGLDAHRHVEVEGHPTRVEWNPDGKRLLMTIAKSPLIDDEYMQTRIRVIDADSGNVSARIENPGKLGQVKWSPNGEHIAMIAGEDLNDPGEGRLMVADAAGGAPRNLIPDYPGHVQSLDWQGDGTVMFVGHEGCEAVFGEVGVDGSGFKRIVPAGGPILETMSLSGDGQSCAFVASTATHPREVYTMSHGDREPKRRTNTNPWLADIAFGEQSVVSFKARDGLELEGVLIKPIAHEPGTRVPLIVTVHGGPEAHETNGWQTNYANPGQVAAAKGYAVFYPNYRGSTGRGVEFSKLSQGDFAGKEFDDLVDGVKHLVEMGLVDEKRVGITGGSYGGYASAWGATALSEHFAASVMFVGISEQISKFGTTDIPNEMYLVHERSWPWESWEHFHQGSPVMHVEKARTPILIMHGKNDTRVHPTQSMMLYRYLKTYGKVPVRLVFYPGEGHGNRNASARLDYNLRMMQWFDHYLAAGDHRNDLPPPHEIDYELPEKKKDESKDEKDEADAV